MEALNKILAERLFKVQDAQELKVSATWVKHLYGFVDKLNDMETKMTGMKPKDVIVLDQILLVKRESYPPEEVMSGKEHDDQRHRATDRIWSKGTYR